eukprot:4438322-Alexandrium_andersonii.AAC.1
MCIRDSAIGGSAGGAEPPMAPTAAPRPTGGPGASGAPRQPHGCAAAPTDRAGSARTPAGAWRPARRR